MHSEDEFDVIMDFWYGENVARFNSTIIVFINRKKQVEDGGIHETIQFRILMNYSRGDFKNRLAEGVRNNLRKFQHVRRRLRRYESPPKIFEDPRLLPERAAY